MPVDADLALVDVAQAGDRLDQLGLAVALDPGDGDDLARAHRQVDACHGDLLAAVVADRQAVAPRGPRSPGVAEALVDRRDRTGRPTIMRRQLSLVVSAGRWWCRRPCRGGGR